MEGQMALRDVTVPVHHDGPWAVGHFGSVVAAPEVERSPRGRFFAVVQGVHPCTSPHPPAPCKYQ